LAILVAVTSMARCCAVRRDKAMVVALSMIAAFPAYGPGLVSAIGVPTRQAPNSAVIGGLAPYPGRSCRGVIGPGPANFAAAARLR
jgi:hypothetical protein